MPCKICSIKPVIELTNNPIKLCSSCFIKYFERKALKTITKYDLIENNEVIAIGSSGGKDSFSVLHIINLLANRKRNIKIKVIAIDEGIEGYRELEFLKKYCKDNNLDLHIYSYKDEFGYSLDEMLKFMKLRPCSICGVLRRFLLNSKARELNADKLATGHNLDDEAQTILMNQFRGNLERSARLGPITGIKRDKRFIPRIKPLYFLMEREVALYAFLKKFPIEFGECPHSVDSYRGEVRDLLNKFEEAHQGTKHAIVNSFLEELPLLKKQFYDREIKSCEKCQEPCSGNICKVCELVESIRVMRQKV